MEATSTPITAPEPGIYAKLYAMMSDLDYIQKDKENTFHHYWYASEAAIKDKVHAALVKHRVLLLSQVADFSEQAVKDKDGKDSKERLTTARLSFRFIDLDTKEEYAGHCYGIGADSMDKGLYKAITGALKYLLTSTFLIPTGDDPEDDAADRARDERERAARAEAQKQQRKPAPVTPKPAPAATPKPAASEPPPVPAVAPADNPNKPWKSFNQMVAAFDAMEKSIGQSCYLAELRRFEIDNPKNFKNSEDAVTCYGAMRARSEARAA